MSEYAYDDSYEEIADLRAQAEQLQDAMVDMLEQRAAMDEEAARQQRSEDTLNSLASKISEALTFATPEEHMKQLNYEAAIEKAREGDWGDYLAAKAAQSESVDGRGAQNDGRALGRRIYEFDAAKGSFRVIGPDDAA